LVIVQKFPVIGIVVYIGPFLHNTLY
jgi:hypothetical protein